MNRYGRGRRSFYLKNFKIMDLKNFTSAIAQIAEEKGIPSEKVVETIEQAIGAAYKKDYGERGQIIKAKLDPATGAVKFWQVKQTVTEDMIYSEEELLKLQEERERGEEPPFAKAAEGEEKVRFNPEKHIMLEEAKKINSKIKAGEDL